jgi:hypothetical protein
MLLALSAATCLVLHAPQAGPSEPRARTMVLHVEGGAILRARARKTEGAWEVSTGEGWQTIPDPRVLRASAEHDLLQQAERLERALPKGDMVRRVAFADWLVHEGLHAEALRALDRVLEQDPDQRDALALLAQSGMRLALPAPERGLAEFLAAAGRTGGSARELAVGRLASAPAEIPGLRQALAGELRSSSSGRRAFATLALRRIFPGSEPSGLLSRAVLDSSDEVRAGAALALKGFGDPGVIEPVVRALGSRHPEVRGNAVAALERMAYREAVEPLYLHLVALQSGSEVHVPHQHIFSGRQRSYVQDFDVEVAQSESIADPVINILIEGSVLDVAVIGVSEARFAGERAAVRRALSKLTGASPGETTVAWQRWWQEHGHAWRAAASPPEAPVTPSGRG